MNRWITALKNHGNAPETKRQKCQNAPWRTYGTFGTTAFVQTVDFSESQDNSAGSYADWTNEARRDLWEERAAIMEYEGGLTRMAAEEEAWRGLFGTLPIPT